MRLSARYISALCMLVTGIYAQSGPHGIDTGNSICYGQCTPNPKDLHCEKPVFKKAKGCFVCCLSDDHLDDFADKIDDDPVPF